MPLQEPLPRPSRRYPGRAAALLLALAALAYVFGTAKVPCAFAWFLAIPCPSCGSGRAVRAALSGDLDSVLRFNPLGILAALVVLAAMLGAVVTTWREGSPRNLGNGAQGKKLARVAAFVVLLEVLLWLVRFTGMLGGPVPV